MDAEDFVWIMFVKHVGRLQGLWAIRATEMEEGTHVLSVQVLYYLP